VVRVEAHTALAPDSGAVGSGSRPVMARASQLETHVDPATGVEVLTGWIAPQWVDTLDVVYPDQNAAYLAALGQAVSERGIVVTGALSPAGCGASDAAGAAHTTAQRLEGGAGATAGRVTTATTPMDTIFVYQSPPLRDVLRAMAKPSQNQIAEILLKTIGLERAGVGRADSGSAVVARQLLAWGAQPDGFVLRDGSGLSRYDYLTPETLVHTLAAIRHDTAFAAFYDALPIAGVDGTIAGRMRGTPAQGNVHAKTGYVANARSLSGYVTTADGRMLIFSALCNNWTVPVRDVERVQDAVAVGLASLRLDEAR
jgi:D-alanyl-D-alanine carboxypeptidase/D-alanyl-D-alanine-endopeptidase (penicillin-binding protein 4)